MLEIERKFLVKSTAYKSQAISEQKITQGFLNTDPERTVRVRLKGDKGFLTIKGKSNESGTSRFEWEKEIDKSAAEQLLNICEPGVLEKTRYEIKSGRHVFEVDVFHGENNGLIVAEIELQDENQSFEKPDWLGLEVTGDIKYYNSQLSKTPYTSW